MKIIGVIPARYASSRFPGKPLADICGKPMIWWVWNSAKQVMEFDEVYVATDDERIAEAVRAFGGEVVMTGDCATGTDRVAKVAQKITADIYVNIQGDEPLIEPDVIRAAILPMLADHEIMVTNLMAKINNPVDALNPTVPKVIVNKDNIGIFLTRSLSPFPKGSLDYVYHKQVCVYGFRASALDFFLNSPRGRIEEIEDIEILRFIENFIKVKFVEVKTRSVAVDTINDLNLVRKITEQENYVNEEINAKNGVHPLT
jgi:3-deoxy-manno-octulosonate cytidylyltransferase (CMP-KDO synthetase)